MGRAGYQNPMKRAAKIETSLSSCCVLDYLCTSQTWANRHATSFPWRDVVPTAS